MDIVAKQRAREFTLLMLVSGMALIANLPERVLNLVNLDRAVIMAVLGLVVLLAVFLYVRMFFFLLYTLDYDGCYFFGQLFCKGFTDRT